MVCGTYQWSTTLGCSCEPTILISTALYVVEVTRRVALQTWNAYHYICFPIMCILSASDAYISEPTVSERRQARSLTRSGAVYGWLRKRGRHELTTDHWQLRYQPHISPIMRPTIARMAGHADSTYRQTLEEEQEC